MFWKRKRRPVEPTGEEEYYYRELGGRVVIRGLTPFEAQGIKSAIEGRITGEREQRVAFMVLAIKNGTVRPSLTETEVVALFEEHPAIAKKLVSRIQRLTEERFKNLGMIR